MASTMLIYGVYVSQLHYMSVGLDMESDGVNDGALWFLGFIWWEVSSHLNSMNEKYSPI
jgi:hypothetical protein